MIREGRLRDWLELLSFEVGTPTRYCHTLPLERFKQLRVLPREELAQRWLPMLSGGYLLRAQKRVRPITPVRMFKAARGYASSAAWSSRRRARRCRVS